MKAFVQQVPAGHHVHISYERNALGFAERGYEVVRFAGAGIDAGALDEALFARPEGCVVSGGVGAVAAALARAGRSPRRPDDLPPALNEWVGREAFETTLGRFRSIVSREPDRLPLHVKPSRRDKAFTGLLVRGFGDLVTSAALPDDLDVLVQSPVEFVSEWRASVLRGRVLNVAHYRGDPLVFPDPDAASAALPSPPRAFAMDWGVTAEGRTLLVEINDGSSLGNYGVPTHLYVAMIEARWREFMGLPDNYVGESLMPDPR